MVLENPRGGNVFVGSYDNLVTPHIQDTGKELTFVEDVWSPENDQRSYMQSIKFDNPYDAQYFGEHYKEVAPMMNLYAEGGIHIKPSHRGRLTELKKRTGKTEAELYNDGNPAHKRMVVFARNSRRWKHGLGGNLFYNEDENLYGFGDWLDKAKGIVKNLGLDRSPAQHIIEFFTNREEQKDPNKQQSKRQTAEYRNRPAINTVLKSEEGKTLVTLPLRQRENNSKTKARSQDIEKQMNVEIFRHQQNSGGSNPIFDIPYIPEKAIILNGSTTSTNVLDSLAKYAGIHNRNPKLSEHPIMHSSRYETPRVINKNEMLGLAAQETKYGAVPFFNFTDYDTDYNRALANSNYFTAYGFIPADNIVRNFDL